MQIDSVLSRFQARTLVFCQDAVAASQTDVQLNIGEVNAGAALTVTGYTMPCAGYVIAQTYDLSAAGTTGSFTIGPTVNGTEKTDLTQTVGTTTTGSKIVGREKIPFAAGDIIGAEITTGGTWDGTSADLVVAVTVLLDYKSTGN